MNHFRQDFGTRRVLLPVIHVQNLRQALCNVSIARVAGADGVFMINHDMRYRQLRTIFEAVRAEWPDLWIGLNFLDLNSLEALDQMPNSANALWVDRAGIGAVDTKQPSPEDIALTRKMVGWQGTYFGGVAFKYQDKVEDVAAVATAARPFMDVVTTSGAATGVAAPVEKLRLMRQALEDHPLALASGVTPKNVHDYLPLVDAFLVATGISVDEHTLDLKRTQDLAQIIHAYPGE